MTLRLRVSGKYNGCVYFVYSLLLGLLMLLATPWWLLQMARHAKYRAGLAQRFGAVPAQLKNIHQRVIWVHAVSVGEVLAVSTLVRQLRERHLNHRVLISTTTATGNQLARDRFGFDNVFYFPLDFGFAIRPYLKALRPEMVVVAETEFWPNFLRLSGNAGAKIAVVNARISDRSFPRYRRWKSVFARVLRPVGVFLAQSEEDARRIIEIGASKDCVHVGGNLKFEVNATANAEIVHRVREGFADGGSQPLIIAGSTVEGEEPMLLHAFAEVLKEYPRMAVILAPRHRERFAAVAKLVADSPFELVRRSDWADEPLPPGTVLLLDSIGELASLYALADVAFVGGSLVRKGGHNILEPAQHGVPIVIGPHYENFRDIIAIFQRADAVRIVEAPQLGSEFIRLLKDHAERSGPSSLGQRAAQVMRAQAGATERTMQALENFLAGGR
ncbi:Three-deoxy-D-manno-octulosonic-acid transferase-like protein [Candidatus Koribacter versatilis Ellin345]|uniref:3-deoxy-D-manno-octulosonic acid transferase n=1 Tax=Koribacter versatilis (strain Ellin345) TaxID=204669 RepID=Q1IHD3_KORVE|nr:3-deoxy-D-manno-octulosonic acid transferase [Candidatus Koribacter versatilis]ABF43717.1 Three-deoxy-D-manno-octulosonic-acid transferase-like protein [Candidatus Koribacter versatilis Ellin345]